MITARFPDWIIYLGKYFFLHTTYGDLCYLFESGCVIITFLKRKPFVILLYWIYFRKKRLFTAGKPIFYLSGEERKRWKKVKTDLNFMIKFRLRLIWRKCHVVLNNILCQLSFFFNHVISKAGYLPSQIYLPYYIEQENI